MFPEHTTKRIFAGVILLNLFLVGGYIGLYIVLKNQVSSTRSLRAEAASEITTSQRQADIRRLVEETEPSRDILDSFFVAANDTAGFITLVESLADTARVNLSINDVSVSTNQENENFETLRLQMRASGRWQRAIHFVRLLESVPKDIVLEDVRLEQAPAIDDTEENGWNVIITLRAVKLPSS